MMDPNAETPPQSAPKLTDYHIEAQIVDERYERDGTLTICILTLANGFKVVGTSACVSPENFDADMGRNIARANAAEKIWELEGYRVRDVLSESERHSIVLSDTYVASVAHEANRALAIFLGEAQPPWNDAPDWQVESALEGVRSILNDPEKRPEDSHEAWRVHKAADGWTYGPVKDPAKKEHPCMVPYRDLPPWQQFKDQLFVAVVRAMLAPLRETSGPPSIIYTTEREQS